MSKSATRAVSQGQLHAQAVAANIVAELAANMAAAQVASGKAAPVPPVVKREPGTRSSRKTKGGKASKVQRFVQKLSNLVNTNHFGRNLCGWNADGMSFVVHDPDQFAEQILPLYFNTTNMSSFTRQLHFYGFKKIVGSKRVQEVWEFQHQWFHRDHPEWLTRISRKRCNVQTVSQEELADMKQQIADLHDLVSSQQQQMTRMYSMLLALTASKNGSPTVDIMAPVSPMEDDEATAGDCIDNGPDRKRKAVHLKPVKAEPAVTRPGLVRMNSLDPENAFALPMMDGFEGGFGLALEDAIDITESGSDNVLDYWSEATA